MYSPRKSSFISTVPFIVISFLTDSSFSVMVHGQPLSLYHTIVCLRHLPIYRLRISPWCHRGLPSQEHFYISKTCILFLFFYQAQVFRGCTASCCTTTHINTGDSMGGSMPTVGMITEELVQTRIARGALESLLCQSKNSEVLNTFHPNSGGGLTMLLEKVWRHTWSVNSSGWFYCKNLCNQGCCSHARRTDLQGGCSRNYTWRIRGGGGCRGGMRRMYCGTEHVTGKYYQ